jgi:EmrB/QacA subfamily drug resistance transporter
VTTSTKPDPGETSAGLDRRQTLGLLLLSLGVALIVVDMSIVNLVLPQIARDLGLGFSGLQYVSALFSLAAAAVVVAAGDVADRIGPRRAYLGGLAVFLAGSALAAVAPSDVVMYGARVIQGLGGGAALTAALGTINAAYSGPARGTAFALYGATFAAACAAGPLLGAVIAELADWRWAFGVNLVVGPLAFVGVARLVPDVAPRAEARRPDVAGTVLVSVALTAVTFAIVQGVEAAWGVAAAAFAAFAVVQRVKVRRSAPAILDPVLTRVRSFTLGSVALLIVGVGEFGLMFLLPLVQQAGQGLSPIEAGLVGLPVPLFAVLAFPLMQAFAARSDERTAVVVGLLLEAAGMVGVALTIGAGPLWIVPGLAIYGLGVGAATAQLSALVLAEVPASRNGLASGISSAVRQLGSTLGVGLLGAVFTAALDGPLADRPVQTVGQMRTRGDEAAVAHAAELLTNGIFAAALVAAAFLVAGAVAIRLQPRRTTGYPEAATAPAAA